MASRAPLEADREQVLAHRIATQGLHRRGAGDEVARVVDLGLQDAGPSARLALAARLPDGPDGRAGPDGPDGPDPAAHGLVDAWTHRGAPHHHRPDGLPGLAAASYPLSDADAAARLAWSGPEQRRVGIPAREAIDRAADAVAAVVTDPMTKGAVSRAVTERLPDALLRDCRPCGCVHVNEQLLRLAALPAGVGLDPTGRALLLTPPSAGHRRPAGADPAAAADLVLRYLRVLGPAGPAEVAGFVGSTPRAFAPAWDAARDALVEVRVEGVAAWLPVGDRDALADPPEPDLVRLLPPSDPLLQARDRELLVPAADHRAALYRPLGNPGAVLADGEVVGIWRPKGSGRRLTLTVEPFGPWAYDVRPRVAEEAERVAAARGMVLAQVVVA